MAELTKRYKVAVVTTSRADFGIWRPVMRALREVASFEPGWIVTGTHLLAAHGYTVEAVEADEAPIFARFESIVSGVAQDAAETARAMARAVSAVADWMPEVSPDVVMVLGDRFEMFAVASALVPFRVPLVHVHGGEVTFGAIDESFRHAMTKLCHLHMTSTGKYAQRIFQLGEEAWRVASVGAPALDEILEAVRTGPPADLDEMPGSPFILATYHPETNLPPDEDLAMVHAMCEAIEQLDVQVIFTAPNADPRGDMVRQELERFVARRGDRAWFVESFGVPRYYHVMAYAACMLGNSSSGILEAASFGLPVVNLGGRQEGRAHAENVRHVVQPQSSQIVETLQWALDRSTRFHLQGLSNPYGDGMASKRIVEALARGLERPDLLRKRFVDRAISVERTR